jgi:hypothetical protein
MKVLKLIKEINYPDCWIGAGFVRNRVWDYLHNYKYDTPLNDIDVVYYSKDYSFQGKDKKLAFELTNNIGKKVSIKNQAFMHLYNNHEQYVSTYNAISYWTETATCIGVRLIDDELQVMAPHGLNDLFALLITPTDASSNGCNIVLRRVHEKNWLSLWPRLTLAPVLKGDRQ